MTNYLHLSNSIYECFVSGLHNHDLVRDIIQDSMKP
jgi:hypothetical protein